MKLGALAKKPQLIKIEIEDEKIVEKYGEAIEFYIYDRYEMEVYMKLLNADDRDIIGLSNVIKQMVMDENGNSVIADGEIIPSDILLKVVEEVVKNLGNSLTQTSKK